MVIYTKILLVLIVKTNNIFEINITEKLIKR